MAGYRHPAARPDPFRLAQGVGGNSHRRAADRGHHRQPTSDKILHEEQTHMNRFWISALLIALVIPLGCKKDNSSASGGGKQITLAMMPKSKGNAYFIACRKGAEEAAKELNVKMIWDGPTDPDPAKQNEIVDTWITRGVDVIAVAVENREGISSVLRKARQRGIKVITWDADAEIDSRDFFVNQATPQGIGDTLMDEAGK